MPQHGHPRPTAAKRPNEGSGGSKHDPAVRRSNAFVMQIHTAPSQLNCLKPNSTAFAVEAHRKGGSQYIATHWLQGWALLTPGPKEGAYNCRVQRVAFEQQAPRRRYDEESHPHKPMPRAPLVRLTFDRLPARRHDRN